MAGKFDDFDDKDELGQTKVTLGVDLGLEVPRASRAHLVMLVGSEVGRVFRLEGVVFSLGRATHSSIRLDDDGVSRAHCTISVSGGEYVVEDQGSSNGTYLNEERVTKATLNDGDKLRIGDSTILRFGRGDLDQRFQEQLYDAALRDALTGAYNKRYFLDALTKEVRFAARHDTDLVLIMFDIDHFKRVNDTYGHVVGDQVLAQLGKLAQEAVRSEDVFARYGGEEFGIIARSINLAQGGQFAERLRAKVEAAPFMVGNQLIPVTLSLGVAQMQRRFADATQFVQAADEALYEAKRAGRNRVVLGRLAR